ncbi:DNA-processing protein DprA [Gleimia sp. 6138-11-ORH1]|uniref:DNA-processing protein DprA n=1 Tax=Gleimia sp. 6138-11-ORH1 TaxID=2973937 RepID=UPI00216A7108|nr:DNA-processing protein DprA [Gleimia sp. 6138-11-ORH1]MCS4484894.1 DNA-processing protein DprA [Gleimia sp. 6138-11-ORH1]
MYKPNLNSPLEVACMWSNLLEPGDTAGGVLISEMGATAALAWLLSGANPTDLPKQIRRLENGKVIPWAKVVARWLPRVPQANVRQQLDLLERQGGELWYPEHPRWPKQLADLGIGAPVALWVKGNLQATPPKAHIALVGARAASGEGEQISQEFAYELVQAGYSVISGGAFGIDAAAHRGAIQATKQPRVNNESQATIAFMAGGINQLYPVSQLDLFDAITECGLIISEVPPTWRPAKWRFLARNRLIAAFSQATVVIEAGWRSGALATAHRGLELGRPVAAVPGSIYSQMSKGCHRLIREAGASLVTSVPDIRELVDPLSESFRREVATEPNLADETEFPSILAQRVWQALPKYGRAQVSSVAVSAGLSVSEVNGALAELLVVGKAQVFADECWRVN